MDKTRKEALRLLYEYTKTEALLRHAYAVEAAMRWYARFYGEDEESWGMAGLLHDFDYERFPQLSKDAHPFAGAKILEQEGYSSEIIQAILGHATYSGVPRQTLMAKTLFACDELAGLVYASVLVRPDRAIANLTAQSVKKKMKDKAFARNVNREDIKTGADELGIDLTEHIENVVKGMQTVAVELGLQGDVK